MEYEELYKWKSFERKTLLTEIERKEEEELNKMSFEELVAYASERSEEGCKLRGLEGLGSQSDSVQLIQSALKELGFEIREEESGTFGSDTLVSILKLQKMKGIRPDGCVGRQTAQYLTKRIRKAVSRKKGQTGGNTNKANSIFQQDPEFTYEEKGNGWINVNPRWISANIVAVPLVGDQKARLHRAVASNFQETYARAVEVSDYTPKSVQTFVTRHIGRDESKPLSLHSFGLAVDFDPQKNPMGGRNSILSADHPFVQVFKRAGWIWGGDWGIKDNMHFEFDIKKTRS